MKSDKKPLEAQPIKPTIYKDEVKERRNIMILQVYLDDGRVCEYEIADSIKAREHASAIVKSGLRHNDGKIVEWYPPHRIWKVKWESDGTTNYISKFKET